MIVEVRVGREWRLICNHCGILVPDGISTGFAKNEWLLEHSLACTKPLVPGAFELLPIWFSTFDTRLIRNRSSALFPVT